MTVPGVYSPEQVQQEAWEQSQGLANRLRGSGKPDSKHPYDATIRAAAESDGVDDSRAVEVMARAMRPELERDNDIYWAAERGYLIPQTSLDALARAALGALRALEGE